MLLNEKSAEIQALLACLRFLVLLHKAADIADEHLRCPFAAEHIALDRQIIAAGVAPFGVAAVIVVVLAGTVYVPYLLNGLLGIQPQLVHHTVELELRVAADEDADAVRIILQQPARRSGRSPRSSPPPPPCCAAWQMLLGDRSREVKKLPTQ